MTIIRLTENEEGKIIGIYAFIHEFLRAKRKAESRGEPLQQVQDGSTKSKGRLGKSLEGDEERQDRGRGTAAASPP